MLIKGEKWACEACVRGHRVSNCQHSDRPLQHINKKGRPVSQCSHCRSLRKSRSAHVCCECGVKTHTKTACEGETQADSCCCSHGARCSCALKKEHLDPVPESDSDEASSSSNPSSVPRRPRAVTAQSETNLTVFANGHHKPGHKHNNMAHKCGLPYVVPRAHSIHGSSPSGLANRSVDNLPHTSTIDALHSESQLKESMVSAQQEQRMVKSEHGSPLISPTSNLEQLNGLLPPLDLSNLPDDYGFMQNIDGFSGLDEQPMFSAGLSATSIDWSHYDGLDFNNNNLGSTAYSQAASFTGFDYGSVDQPALTTTSTSGEVSEVEEYGVIADNQRKALNNQKYGSDLSNSEFGGDVDGFHLSTASSYVGLSQGHGLSSNAFDGLVMEQYIGVSGNGFVSSNGFPSFESNVKDEHVSGYKSESDLSLLHGEEDDAFWINGMSSNSCFPISNSNNRIADNFWAQ